MKARNLKQSAVENQQVGSVVVLYESPAARERAIGFAEPFAGQLRSSANQSIHWYAFADLGVASKMELITQVAAAAEVVAFAVNSAGDMPNPVKLWTEKWLLRRGEREGLLVGLVLDEGTGLGGIACLKEIYLRHLAHRAGLNYLSHFPETFRKVMPDSLDSFIQRADRVTPLLDDILHTRFITPVPPLK